MAVSFSIVCNQLTLSAVAFTFRDAVSLLKCEYTGLVLTDPCNELVKSTYNLHAMHFWCRVKLFEWWFNTNLVS